MIVLQNHTTLRVAWPHAGEGNGTASAARRFRRPHASRRAAPHRKTALRARHAARARPTDGLVGACSIYYSGAPALVPFDVEL